MSILAEGDNSPEFYDRRPIASRTGPRDLPRFGDRQLAYLSPGATSPERISRGTWRYTCSANMPFSSHSTA